MGLIDAKLVKNGNKYEWSGEGNNNYYMEMFEEEYIRESKMYYKSQALQWLNSLSCPQFLMEAFLALEREEAKADKFHISQTMSLLMIENVIIVDNVKEICEVQRLYIYNM